jgi:hypothetical protein
MFYEYDVCGWYCGIFETEKLRTTSIEPKNKSLTVVDGEPRANWTGYEWKDLEYWTLTEEMLKQATIPDYTIEELQKLQNLETQILNIDKSSNATIIEN